MINSLWISKTGMEAQQMQLDVISNNLANVSTNGFKKSHAVFEDLMYQNLRQVGANTTDQSQLPTGLHLGLGVRTVATSRNFAQGNLQQTGNNLDIAIQGNGFFQLTMPDGTIGLHPRRSPSRSTTRAAWSPPAGLPVSGGITVPSQCHRSLRGSGRHRLRPIPGNHRAAIHWHHHPGQLRQSGRTGTQRAKTSMPKAPHPGNPMRAPPVPMAWAR